LRSRYSRAWLPLLGRRSVRPSRFHLRPLVHFTHSFCSVAKASEETHEPKDATEAAESDFLDPRQKILSSALKHVVTHGWSAEALAQGAADQGFPGVASGLFARGPVELVEYFIDLCKETMITQLKSVDLETMSLRDRIKTALKIRLQMQAPYVSRWPQALSLLAYPPNLPSSFPRLAE